MRTEKQSIIAIVIIICAGLGLLFGATFLFRSMNDNDDEVVQRGDIISMIVDRPIFVIKSRNILSAKIYGTTNNLSQEPILLGEAKKTGELEGIQRFEADIPKEPLLLERIYVIGTDSVGELDKFYFAIEGASLIYSALWEDTPIIVNEFRVGDEYVVSKNIKLKLEDVKNDSRCPINVTCVTAGDISVHFILDTNGVKKDIYLSNQNKTASLSPAYSIEIESILPLPVAGETIAQKDYRIVLKIKEESKS